MFAASEYNGTNLWLDLQLYPAALVFYAAGFALVAAERFDLLKVLTRNFTTRAVDLNRKVGLALPRLGLQGVFNKDVLNRALGTNFYVPFSQRVHDLFAPVIARQLPAVSDFDNLFDVFEYMGALIVTDDRMAQGKVGFADGLASGRTRIAMGRMPKPQ